MDILELTAQRALLKYAVQRAIFNRDGSIADIRRSVLVQVTVGEHTSSQLLAGEDFDASVAPLFAEMRPETVVEVWDGRTLNGRSKNRDAGHYVVTNAPVVDPNQETLFS